MPVNKNERRYHDTSFLRGDARAVIDAEFEELRTGNQTRTFLHLMKDGFQWIKQRLQRA